MNEPELPAATRHLIDVARRERPSAGLEQRVLVALAERKPSMPVWAWSFVALGAAAAVGGLFIERELSSPSAVAFGAVPGELRPDRAPALSPSDMAVPVVSVVAQDTQTSVSPLPQPSNPTSALDEGPSPRRNPNARSASWGLSREIELLGRTKTALAADNPQEALRLLERYAALGGAAGSVGQLAAEAQVLRIDALARSGSTERAEREARDFLRNHPTSPLVDSARRFVPELSATGSTTQR
jgi:hypothetical protein